MTFTDEELEQNIQNFSSNEVRKEQVQDNTSYNQEQNYQENSIPEQEQQEKTYQQEYTQTPEQEPEQNQYGSQPQQTKEPEYNQQQQQNYNQQIWNGPQQTDTQEYSSEQQEEEEQQEVEQEENREPEINPVEKEALAPLKANGRLYNLSSIDELRQLAQKGIGFTQKAQKLAQYNKYIKLLEENNLLDTNKLSFAVDLFKKDPKAISKLLRDTGIDPLEINPEDADNYKPIDYAGSEEKQALDNAIAQIQEFPDGQEFISDFARRILNDKNAQEEVLKAPHIISQLYETKRIGLYDQVIAELDKQIALNPYYVNIPFLQAFSDIAGRIIQNQNIAKANAQPNQSPYMPPYQNSPQYIQPPMQQQPMYNNYQQQPQYGYQQPVQQPMQQPVYNQQGYVQQPSPQKRVGLKVPTAKVNNNLNEQAKRFSKGAQPPATKNNIPHRHLSDEELLTAIAQFGV